MNIPMVKVPTFTMTLPFTKEEVKFRPYVVKEEKLLILANETETITDAISAIGDIIKNCTFNVIDIETTPMFDVQYAFLQIRGKSIGEIIEYQCNCGTCNHTTPASVSVKDFTLKTTPGHTNKIMLDDGFYVTMKYPTFKHFSMLYDTDDEEKTFDAICECIDTIYNNEEVFKYSPELHKDFREFLDNLTVQQFEKIENFFITMPILQYTTSYVCTNCQNDNSIVIDGISNFFD
jgi:hypothetical protein